jgi:hypothetical protein
VFQAVVTERGVMLRDPQIEELMAAHRQHGGMSALQMPAAFCAMPLTTCRNVDDVMNFASLSKCVLGAGALTLSLVAVPAWAQEAARTSAAAPQQEPGIRAWLERLHEAARRRAYTGTFVVSNGTEMASSKIWHVCDGSQQFERIETLTGQRRTTLRRNDEVMTFIPESKVVLKERREALRLFPGLLQTPGQQIEALYAARTGPTERVAGFEATVIDFVPKDGLRYGYRIWSEKTRVWSSSCKPATPTARCWSRWPSPSCNSMHRSRWTCWHARWTTPTATRWSAPSCAKPRPRPKAGACPET